MNKHGPKKKKKHIHHNGNGVSKMNELTAEQWVDSFYPLTDKTAPDGADTEHSARSPERYFAWLGRMTNRSYEAWLIRGGDQSTVE